MTGFQSHAFTGPRWRSRRFAVVIAFLTLLLTSCAGARTAHADDTTAPPGPVSLVDLDDPAAVAAWTTVNDPVMGGRSTSEITFGGGLVFSGNLAGEQRRFRLRPQSAGPRDRAKAAGATSLRVRAVGDGKTYVLRVGAAGQPWSTSSASHRGRRRAEL